ncbi:MAG: ABC transporter ATP-binding protein [Gammaproteobacteria bacterium]
MSDGAPESLPRTRELLGGFLRDLVTWRGKRIALLAGLSLLLSLTEGIGLLLIVPLLALIGLGDGAVSGLAAQFSQAFPALGLEFNLVSVLALFLVLIALRQALTFRREILGNELSLGFIEHLRNRLFRDITAAHWRFLATHRHADLLHTLGPDVQRVGFAIQQTIQLFVQSSLAAAYVIGALLVAPGLSVVALGAAAILMLVFRGARKRALRQGQRMVGGQRALTHTLEQLLGALKWVKAHAAEAAHVRLFAEQTRELRESQHAERRYQAAVSGAYQFGGALALVIVVLGARELDVPAANLLVLLLILSRLLPMLGGLQQASLHIMRTLPVYHALVHTQKQAQEAREPADSASLPDFAERISLRDVHFRHPNSGRGIDIAHLDIPKNALVAFIGPSGAGKTTLADIIAGLLIPQAGELRIDDHPLTDGQRRAWRQRIAYVPQEGLILDASLRTNLLAGLNDDERRSISDAELYAALDAAGANGVLAALPDGLETLLGPRGVRLSGGERQRVAIARTLLAKPALLILDEATSALDADNERRIQAAIEGLRGSLTLIVIAHRLSTVRNADHIAVLEDGTLTQYGTWAGLAAETDGVFARLLHADRTVSPHSP